MRAQEVGKKSSSIRLLFKRQRVYNTFIDKHNLELFDNYKIFSRHCFLL